MIQTGDFLKRAATRTGFRRDFFVEKNYPTNLSNILAVPFYGDLRSTFNLSSFFLKQYKEANPSAYVILCSWPGLKDLFPYVDEYWSLEDETATKSLAIGANNLYNSSNLAADIHRRLLEVVNILSPHEIKEWYDDGFTKRYWADFKEIKRFLPGVPSSSRLTESFLKEIERKPGRKVVVFPATKILTWHKGVPTYFPIQKVFWDALFETLLGAGFVPVVYQNWFTYDMSREFTDRCVYLVPRHVSDLLAAIRYLGLVLDIHSGFSRLAIAARTPFVAVDERLRFMESHDYAVDDLCCQTPRKYIFSFATMLLSGGSAEWKDSILDNVLVTLREFSDSLDTAELADTDEAYEPVSYERVRQRTAKRLGLTFINSKKHKEKHDG